MLDLTLTVQIGYIAYIITLLNNIDTKLLNRFRFRNLQMLNVTFISYIINSITNFILFIGTSDSPISILTSPKSRRNLNPDVVFSNGLTTPQSPKPLVPDICVKTGHNFSNLLPMLGYCEQCSVRVFVGMFFNFLI